VSAQHPVFGRSGRFAVAEPKRRFVGSLQIVRYRFASLCPAVVQFRKGPRSAETHNRN